MPSGWWDTVVFDERSERPLLPFLLAAITMWATAFVLAFLSGLPLTFPVPVGRPCGAISRLGCASSRLLPPANRA
jgi:hypothetical protein